MNEIVICLIALGLGVASTWIYNAERRLRKLEGKEVRA